MLRVWQFTQDELKQCNIKLKKRKNRRSSPSQKKKKEGKIEEDRKFSSKHLDLFGVDTK